jgi:hypothetical protein
LFGALGTVLKWIVLLPVFLAIVLLAVANDQPVTVHLNPFDAADPVLKVDLALYQIAFILFAAGVIVGGIVAWNGQRRARRRAQERAAAAPWQARTGPALRRADEMPASRASAFLPRPERG